MNPWPGGSLVPRALVIAAVLAVAVPLAVVRLGELPPPVTVSVEGQFRYLRQGTTFGQVIHAFGLKASSGKLFDVEGAVIDPHADPGHVLLNGQSASHKTALAEGDAVVVDNGRDRTEGTRVVRTPLPGRQPGDPQFFLGTSKVIEETTEGRISGKVVALTYRSVGKAKRPPAVALTFDDGPWSGSTRKILHILHHFHVLATFFVIGQQAEAHPQLVHREIEQGMTVGNHSWDHPNTIAFSKLAPHRLMEEMSRTDDQLRKLGVKDPRYMRPPGGSYDGRMIAIARSFGLRLVNWDVDPRDWESGATRESIVRNVLANVRPGSIVDLHDGGGNQSATVRALPLIIKGIRRMHLKLVALPA